MTFQVAVFVLDCYYHNALRSATVDANDDGELSDAELRDYLKRGFAYEDELVTKMFAGIDFDSSGKISSEELRTAFVKYPTLRTAPGLGGLFKSAWPAMDDGVRGLVRKTMACRFQNRVASQSGRS